MTSLDDSVSDSKSGKQEDVIVVQSKVGSPVMPKDIDKTSTNFENADLPPELVSLMDQFAKMKEEMAEQMARKRSAAVAKQKTAPPKSWTEQKQTVEPAESKPKKQKIRFAESDDGPPGQDCGLKLEKVSPDESTEKVLEEESGVYEPTSAISPLSPDEDFFESSPFHSPDLAIAVPEYDLEQKMEEKEGKGEKVSEKTLQKRMRKEKKLQKLLMEATSTTGDDDIPSSATDLQRREKLLSKYNFQLRVEDEVKQVLRPYYAQKQITKEEYKNVMRKAVPKITKKKGKINPVKIKSFVEVYIENTIKSRTKKKKLL